MSTGDDKVVIRISSNAREIARDFVMLSNEEMYERTLNRANGTSNACVLMIYGTLSPITSSNKAA